MHCTFGWSDVPAHGLEACMCNEGVQQSASARKEGRRVAQLSLAGVIDGAEVAGGREGRGGGVGGGTETPHKQNETFALA